MAFYTKNGDGGFSSLSSASLIISLWPSMAVRSGFFSLGVILLKPYLFIYLLGCLRSQLWHAGSSSHRANLLPWPINSLVVAGGHLSPQTRDQLCIPCNARSVLNPWTTREIPSALALLTFLTGWPLVVGFPWQLSWFKNQPAMQETSV